MDVMKNLTNLKKYRDSINGKVFASKENKIYIGDTLFLEPPSKKSCDWLLEKLSSTIEVELKRVNSIIEKVETQLKAIQDSLEDEVDYNSEENCIEPIATLEECSQAEQEHAKELAEGYKQIEDKEILKLSKSTSEQTEKTVETVEVESSPKKQGFGNCGDCEWDSKKCTVERDSDQCVLNKKEKVIKSDIVEPEPTEIDFVKAVDEALNEELPE